MTFRRCSLIISIPIRLLLGVVEQIKRNKLTIKIMNMLYINKENFSNWELPLPSTANIDVLSHVSSFTGQLASFFYTSLPDISPLCAGCFVFILAITEYRADVSSALENRLDTDIIHEDQHRQEEDRRSLIDICYATIPRDTTIYSHTTSTRERITGHNFCFFYDYNDRTAKSIIDMPTSFSAELITLSVDGRWFTGYKIGLVRNNANNVNRTKQLPVSSIW